LAPQTPSFLEREFAPQFTADDLVNLTKFTIYLKLMVDGVATSPFSASTLPPMAKLTGNAEKVIQVSRERYAMPRSVINEKVLRWSGMETGTLRESDVESRTIDPDDLPNINLSDVKANANEALDSEEQKESKEIPEAKEFLRATNVKSDEDEAADKEEEYLRISPERLESLQKMANAGQGKKKDKPKFSHTCSRCGKVWDMPVQLDPSRPMYCSDCLPIIRDEQKDKSRIKRRGPEPESANDKRDRPPKPLKHKSKEPNKPRIIGNIDLPPISELPPLEDDPDEPPFMGKGGLIGDIEKRSGKQIETRKRQVEKRMDQKPEKRNDRQNNPNNQNEKRDDVKPPSQREAPKDRPKPKEEPKELDRPESLIVFKKKQPAPTQDNSSSAYPSVKTGNGYNPLDKRQSHGLRSDASGQQPHQSSGPVTLNPGSRVTFD
jgi:CxxC-x17-CxxC domain-containing protein